MKKAFVEQEAVHFHIALFEVVLEVEEDCCYMIVKDN